MDKSQHGQEEKLEYYPYIIFYVDDILGIHYDPDDLLNKLNWEAKISQEF